MSTKLLRLKQGPSSAGRDGELEDTIQELEARVDTLESQRRALQSKLSLAKQHILDLGIRTHNRPRTGEEFTVFTVVACEYKEYGTLNDLVSQYYIST